jgi:hypothetical protein
MPRRVSACFACVLAFLVLAILAAPAPGRATTLWYNGDLNLTNVLSNQITLPSTYSTVYDDFIVPSGTSWNINTVWSNNLLSSGDSSGITQAQWEIRSGVSAGNGGTVVKSGTGAATVTATGHNVGGWNGHEYTVQVNGLNVSLGPGTYWLSVCPIGVDGLSQITLTSGANAVGQPPGNDSNSFLNSNSYNFKSIVEYYGGGQRDFSMGIGGTPVPLPPSLLLLGSGLLGLAGLGRRKFRKN